MDAIWFSEFIDLAFTLDLKPSKSGLVIFLAQDNNLGLVEQVLASMYKRNIQRLTQTYLTLSLEDIANTVQLSSAKEAEMHVLQMVVSMYYQWTFGITNSCCYLTLLYQIVDPRW